MACTMDDRGRRLEDVSKPLAGLFTERAEAATMVRRQDQKWRVGQWSDMRFGGRTGLSKPSGLLGRHAARQSMHAPTLDRCQAGL